MFVHSRRDLRDVAVSCWMTDFRSIRWANDPEHIASRFQQYRRLMDHWKEVLPAPIHEVNYEETVADLEAVARRLVAACGLDWEPACLEFHRTDRPVRTASVMQVRQPVYSGRSRAGNTTSRLCPSYSRHCRKSTASPDSSPLNCGLVPMRQTTGVATRASGILKEEPRRRAPGLKAGPAGRLAFSFPRAHDGSLHGYRATTTERVAGRVSVWRCIGGSGAALARCGAAAQTGPEIAAVDYLAQVKPILTRHCVVVSRRGQAPGRSTPRHGRGCTQGGKNGPAVIAGRGDESPLIAAVTRRGRASACR